MELLGFVLEQVSSYLLWLVSLCWLLSSSGWHHKHTPGLPQVQLAPQAHTWPSTGAAGTTSTHLVFHRCSWHHKHTGLPQVQLAPQAHLTFHRSSWHHHRHTPGLSQLQLAPQAHTWPYLVTLTWNGYIFVPDTVPDTECLRPLTTCSNPKSR